jgi:hypothetical protein
VEQKLQCTTRAAFSVELVSGCFGRARQVIAR